jgi:peptidoglycan/LPS O-acetylase OafA/YrhL
MATSESGRGIDPGSSVALDVARFLFALSVAGAHWMQRYFQDGAPDLTPLALASVGGFFVLSGFTIRLVTAGAPFRLEDYLVKRLARLWSVVLPALLATVALDSISALVNPTFYLANWPQEFSLLGVTANALFLTQMWGMDIGPLSNTPFWSIGYEAWFYVLYGLVLARKPIAAVVLALAAGPNIWFLMPLWVSGIAIYELLQRARTRGQVMFLLCGALLTCALILGALTVRWDQVHGVYERSLEAYFGFFHVSPARAGRSFSLTAGAITFVPALLALLAAIKLTSASVPHRVMNVARWLGEFTFPLYLLHVPLFVLCASIGFYNRHSRIETAATFAAICLVISFTVPLTNRLKRALQRALPRITAGYPAAASR